MAELFIPPRTRDEIRSPAPVGQRHEQAKRIAISLKGQGLNPEAIFAQLRGMYEDDFSDDEIAGLITWVTGKNPQPCRKKSIFNFRNSNKDRPRFTKEQAIANAKKFLADCHCTIADLWHESSVRPSTDWLEDAALLISTLYRPDELLNVVWDFVPDRKKPDKAYPRGGGLTLSRDDWIETLRQYENPCGDAGCWIRPNPVSSKQGSGREGSFTDKDVAAYRFLLLESDDLPIGLQFSLWSALALPVAALIDTGGRSLHAWLRIDAKDEATYRRTAAEIYSSLAPFGPCHANKNPSRLSRLPGVKRQIGGDGMAEQRLFYLNPSPCWRPIFEKR
jgi:hypothetical protein